MHNHYTSIFLKKESARRNEQVTLTENCIGYLWDHQESLPQATVLAFADFNKLFLLETDASKQGLGAVILQKQMDGQYHLVAYVSQSLTVHVHNYHSTKQEFLALKWVIVDQCQEYMLWKLFVVKTDKNLLTYIMTTPNLSGTWYCWVESLAGVIFSIEYQKGWESAAANALSQITLKMYTETVKSILDGVTVDQQEEEMYMTQWWLQLMKRYISKSGKLLSKLEPPICVWTYMWLTGWPLNGKIQCSGPWLSGSLIELESTASEASLGRWCKHWGGNGHSSRAEKANALPGSPLSLPYTSWRAGRNYVVCSPQSSLNGCHE